MGNEERCIRCGKFGGCSGDGDVEGSPSCPICFQLFREEFHRGSTTATTFPMWAAANPIAPAPSPPPAQQQASQQQAHRCRCAQYEALERERLYLRSQLGDVKGERDTWRQRCERAEKALDVALRRKR